MAPSKADPGTSVSSADASTSALAPVTRVLIVEDSPVARKLAKSALDVARGTEFETEMVETLKDALKALAHHDFDAILLDLSLPDSSGVDTVERVLEAAPGVPVVVYTAESDEGLALEAVRKGAQDYVVKAETSGEVLVRAIKYAIERERMRAEIDAVIAMAAHDLRAPATHTLAFSELLESRAKDKLNESELELLQHLKESGQRMLLLIKDWISYARIRRSTPIYEDIDIEAICQESWNALSNEVTAAQAQLHVGDVPTIRGTSSMFEQLFRNLFENAIRYRREGIPPTIHVEAAPDEDDWSFRVKDNGIGIPHEHVEAAFKPFRRLVPQEEGEPSGTGLGLAICRTIVEKHGGIMWVDETSHEGTTFAFRLPIR